MRHQAVGRISFYTPPGTAGTVASTQRMVLIHCILSAFRYQRVAPSQIIICHTEPARQVALLMLTKNSTYGRTQRMKAEGA